MRIYTVNNQGMGELGATNLTPAQIYQTAVGAGFPPSVATQMTAISLRETGGTGNPNAFYGGTAANPEASYGLWQINWNDPGVKARLASVGITDPNQLYDPATNAQAAFALYNNNPANLNVAWYIDKGGVYTAGYQQYLPVAEQAAQDSGGGGGGGSGSGVVVGGGDTGVVDDGSGDGNVDDSGTTDNTGLLIAAGVAGLIAVMVLSR